LFRSHGDRARLIYRGTGDKYLRKGLLDHDWTGLVKRVAGMGMPTVRVLDSSPFDREMRRFHNYMKDTPAFQQQSDGHQEFRFPPFSSWMVFTDTVSYACISGQFAFVHTSIVRLGSCRLPELAPINVMRQAAMADQAGGTNQSCSRSCATSRRSITSSTVIKSITPSFSMRVPQRSCSGFWPRYFCAASANLSTQRSSEP